MKIKDVVNTVQANVHTNFYDDDMELHFGFASDLMSDVLAYACSDSLLITGLNNPQVIRTVEMLDIHVVLFVRGKKPGKEIIDLSKENSITVLSTDYTMFKTCGLLVMNGMEGLEIYD